MVLAAKDKVAAVKAKVAAAKAKGKQTEIAAAPTAIPEGSPTAVEATVNEPATNVAEVQPKNPLSARVPAESGDGGDGDVVTGDVVYSLEQITEESGVNAAKVNGYRRAGLLPADSFTKVGKTYQYTEAGLQAVKSLQAAGTGVPRAGAPAKAAGGARRGRPPASAATVAETAQRATVSAKGATDAYAALDRAIDAAQAQASHYAELTASLKATRKRLGR